jgi:hypothetical protein
MLCPSVVPSTRRTEPLIWQLRNTDGSDIPFETPFLEATIFFEPEKRYSLAADAPVPGMTVTGVPIALEDMSGSDITYSWMEDRNELLHALESD